MSFQVAELIVLTEAMWKDATRDNSLGDLPQWHGAEDIGILPALQVADDSAVAQQLAAAEACRVPGCQAVVPIKLRRLHLGGHLLLADAPLQDKT